MGKFSEYNSEKKEFVYVNGTSCPNGVERNVKVKLHCGVENEMTDASEPATCSY